MHLCKDPKSVVIWPPRVFIIGFGSNAEQQVWQVFGKGVVHELHHLLRSKCL